MSPIMMRLVETSCIICKATQDAFKPQHEWIILSIVLPTSSNNAIMHAIDNNAKNCCILHISECIFYQVALI